MMTADGVYVTGSSGVTWNGDGGTAPIHAHSESDDIVVLKLDTSGAYQWHTFYGSSASDGGYGIAVTSDGVYVTGSSGATWNGDGGTAPIHAHSGSGDIVVMKLDRSGACQWHTFYGSSSYDYGNGIAMTSDGVYVTGGSEDTWNGDGGTPPIHIHSGFYDIVVMKLSDTNALTYDGNGATTGSVPVDPGSPYMQGTTVTVLDNTGSLFRDGFTFNGWNTAADGSGTSYAALDTFSMPAENVVLYAQWAQIPTCTVTYDGNGSTAGSVPVDAGSPYMQGMTVTVQDNTGSLFRDGFTFNGWNTAADGSGTSYAALDTFSMPAENVVLYAQWETNATAIPTLSEWGMIIFALLTAGVIIVFMRRKDMFI